MRPEQRARRACAFCLLSDEREGERASSSRATRYASMNTPEKKATMECRSTSLEPRSRFLP